MKNILLSLGFIGFCIFANAQVGIGTTTPNASLDVVKSTTNPTTAKDGIIPPNVSKLELASKVANTYGTTQTGAIVYVATINVVATEPSVAQVANITTPGYYYFDGAVWQKMSATAGGDSTNDAWVNNPASTRVELGTTSTGIARTLGSEVVVTDAGRLGIGTGTDVPDAGLHIIGDNDGWKDDIRLDSYSGNATPGANFRFYGARGTKATPLSVIAGDVLGQMNFWYHNGTNFPGSGARITSIYRSTAGADLSFSTGGSTNSSMVITDAGRVGIGTSTPASTLQVVGSPTVTTALDGIIAPKLTGDQLKAKTYTAAQDGTLVYVTAATTTPAGQTINVDDTGYYYFSGTDLAWYRLQKATKNWVFDDSYSVAAAGFVDQTVAASPSTSQTIVNNINLGLAITVNIPAYSNVRVTVNYSVPMAVNSTTITPSGYYGIRFLKGTTEADTGSRKVTINAKSGSSLPLLMSTVGASYSEDITNNGPATTVTYTLNGYVEHAQSSPSAPYRFNMYATSGSNFNWGRANMNAQVFRKAL